MVNLVLALMAEWREFGSIFVCISNSWCPGPSQQGIVRVCRCIPSPLLTFCTGVLGGSVLSVSHHMAGFLILVVALWWPDDTSILHVKAYHRLVQQTEASVVDFLLFFLLFNYFLPSPRKKWRKRLKRWTVPR